ncbi:MAG TPA: glutamate--cysteine ligase [Burkholderiales bacterium]|nr:glutamate--cysteine ligase [Burkholderiales bacterium]
MAGIRRGIEKESLRVSPDGTLAATPHPPALGSPLTHPHITTDFSEAQLELITGVHGDVHACLEELTRIHQVVCRSIGEELLWCASMPGELPHDDAIPIARYGTSNVARAKTVYRIGLAHRYGRRMQTISGIHYNFSLEAAWPLPAALGGANDAYFALIRNFRRHSWLLVYLLGASPAVCESFVAGREHALQPFGPGTLYAPYATSLRMGPLGYQSEAQAALDVSYNSLEVYAASLEAALSTPYPPYEAIGVRDGDDYRQLSTHLLQIENEFYGTIRPKRGIRRGERPLHALRERGVEYIEVRLVDLDPFSPIGITAEAVRLLDIFLLHCLLSHSPLDTPDERAAIARNLHAVAIRGREPDLALERGRETVTLAQWAAELLDACVPIAAALDRGAGRPHADVLSAAVAAVGDARSTPSARMIEEMERRHGRSHRRFALAHSLDHRSALTSMPLPPEEEQRLAGLAEQSLTKQREIEAADSVPFDDYRAHYVSPERLGV